MDRPADEQKGVKTHVRIEDGRAQCPTRGDVDIDLCAGCGDLVRAERVGDDLSFVCRAHRPITGLVPIRR